jgi:hypothetical protein
VELFEGPLLNFSPSTARAIIVDEHHRQENNGKSKYEKNEGFHAKGGAVIGMKKATVCMLSFTIQCKIETLGS